MYLCYKCQVVKTTRATYTSSISGYKKVQGQLKAALSIFIHVTKTFNIKWSQVCLNRFTNFILWLLLYYPNTYLKNTDNTSLQLDAIHYLKCYIFTNRIDFVFWSPLSLFITKGPRCFCLTYICTFLRLLQSYIPLIYQHQQKTEDFLMTHPIHK